MHYIFPTPAVYTAKDDNFIFEDKVYLTVPENFSNTHFKKLVPELWNNFTAGKSELVIVKSPNLRTTAYISTSLTAIIQNTKTDYEYELKCERCGIIINYKCENGLIHAFSTLLQVLPPYSLKEKCFVLPCFEVKDKPALAFRGMHLCVFPETSLTFLKKMVRLFGLMKCTHIVIEFFATFSFECFPYLAWENSFAKEDIAPIVNDGKALGIEFIPMFNHFGHAGGSRFRSGKNVVLDRAPEYEEYFLTGGWTWNTENTDVLELHEKMRRELCELFGEGKYFHIGCDEVYAAEPFADPYDKNENQSFMKFINDTAEKIKAMGRTPIMWGDMFLDDKDFPYPYCGNIAHRCCDGENNLKTLSDNVIIADWQYNIDGTRRESVDLFLGYKDKSSLILCPWTGFDNIKGRCDIAKEYGLLGVMGTTWNDICRDPKLAVYTACLMWETKENETPSNRWEVFKMMTAQNIRKLVPSGGVYENAGFYEKELDYKPV